GRAVEGVMRRISEISVLIDAVLEMEARREFASRAARPAVVSSLLRDLAEAGFEAWTEELWTPAPEGDVWIGDRGGELAEFLRDHPAWEVV
ncbi:MAG: hypothetical protein ACRDSJ_23340, partial [Rubrobacteraceae bacterium]